MKLRSPDDDIQGCELSNLAPVSSSLGNVIAMPGCGLNITGCAGEAVGSGANHALTTSGSVILTPSDSTALSSLLAGTLARMKRGLNQTARISSSFLPGSHRSHLVRV